MHIRIYIYIYIYIYIFVYHVCLNLQVLRYQGDSHRPPSQHKPASGREELKANPNTIVVPTLPLEQTVSEQHQSPTRLLHRHAQLPIVA